MSLKIKLPPKVSEDAYDMPQSSTHEQPRRRLVNKRRIAIDSDEEEGEEDSYGDQTQDTAVPESPEYSGTSPVDILNDFATSSPPLTRYTSEAPSQASGSTSTIPTKRSKVKTNEEKSRPSKKRRAAAEMFTDSEDEFTAAVVPEDDLDDWEPEEKGKKGSAKKPKGKLMATAPAKGKKTGTTVNREGSPPAAGLKRGRSKATLGEDTVDIDDVENVADDPTPAPSAAAPAPKKRKLPTIKKIKPTAGGAGPTGTTTTPTTTSATPNNAANSVLAELGRETKLASRKIPGQLGNSDLDLMNASVYKDLFGSGGNASRSGMSRREKEEERRKELNKMREEAKAKRLADATPPFDLQRQADKIARFDEELRNRRSNALWPNFLGAKWRELLDRDREMRERERHREREGGWQMGAQSQAKGWDITPGVVKQ